MAAAQYFAQAYRAARARFLEAVSRRGGEFESFENPDCRGPNGEALVTDAACFGDPAAKRLLVLTSATHGVEGFCGSGCQIGLIEEGVISQPAEGVCVLAVHAINPYGFAWLRRVNEDNIDLNRNSVDHQRPPPTSAEYLELHPHLVPKAWSGPVREHAEAAIAQFIKTRGPRAFQAAVSGGQYSHPDGLFYGGSKLAWSTLMLRTLMARHGAGKSHVAMIDFHTGLGPPGHGEAIYTGNDDGELARTRQWYGSDVTSTYGGDSASAVVQGPLINGVRETVAQAEFTPLAIEYGTLPLTEVLDAMRAEQWLTLHGDAASVEGRQIKERMRASFYVDTVGWKSDVFQRAHELTAKALQGLAG